MFSVRRGSALVRTACLTSALLGSAAVPAVAQTTPIFRMDYSASTFPDSNWPAGAHKTQEIGRRYTETLLTGAGPAGQNIVRFTQLSALGLSDRGGQYSFGWEHAVDNTNPTYGATRYYRFRMRVTADSNGRGVNWNDGGLGDTTVKVMIIGAGGTCTSGTHCRYIAHFGVRRSDQRIQFRVGTDADIPPEGNTDYLWSRGQWLDVQFGIRMSSANGRSDGQLKAWINNNNYGAPDILVNNWVMNPVNFRSVGIGLFNNSGLAADGVFKLDMTDFELDDEFHTNWSSVSGVGGAPLPRPSAPGNLRVLTSSTAAVGILRALPVIIRRRRRAANPERAARAQDVS